MRVRLSNHQSKQEKNTQYKQTHQQTPPRSVSLFVLLKTTRKTHTKFMLIKILGNEHINL